MRPSSVESVDEKGYVFEEWVSHGNSLGFVESMTF